MYIFSSAGAHSEAVRKRLSAALHQAAQQPIRELHDYALYFVDAPRLSDQHRQDLASILQARPGLPFDAKAAASQPGFLITPRPGMISPWSSKATDIVRAVGLDKVRRVEHGRCYLIKVSPSERPKASAVLHDRMTEICRRPDCDLSVLFASAAPAPLVFYDLDHLAEALADANDRMQLALSKRSLEYLVNYYTAARRSPSDAELVMFAQANSEHCRHNTFNAALKIDGNAYPHSLFDLIRQTNARTLSQRVLSAYKDNAAVIQGYGKRPISIKAETHNHPTGISPYAGAATGSGGEIRDEMAVGRGGSVTAGLCGFTVSHLRMEGFEQPWESGCITHPDHLASPLKIMLEAPIGAADYNNEYGRPCLAGYFRTFEQHDFFSKHAEQETKRRAVQWWGYHKPIMIAGGHGAVRHEHVEKQDFPAGALLIVLGGPAMRIGLGGSTSSSQSGRGDRKEIDFASVQRGNAEMQRRCHEVIAWCTSQAGDNPIAAIHDLGAGGLSNAVPELLLNAGMGGEIDLAMVPSADSSLSAMEIWCNEAQERYLLAVKPAALKALQAACTRERCPMAVIGRATATKDLLVKSGDPDLYAVSLPLSIVIDSAQREQKEFAETDARALPLQNLSRGMPWPDLDEACRRVLSLPAAAAKHFLITIADRTVGGLSMRDPMVGPWQVPVADCAVSADGFQQRSGVAMAMGERSPAAALDPAASVRLAIAEAITNILSADVQALHDIVLSANWMADCSSSSCQADLFSAVRAASELCVDLGISIPVGKDSLSMRTTWKRAGQSMEVRSPVSLIVSAFAPLPAIDRSLTPQLVMQTEAPLFLIDLGCENHGLGASALAQVYPDHAGLAAQAAADLIQPQALKNLHKLLAELRAKELILAYHDRSDGGLFVSLCEMAFASRCGLDVSIDLPWDLLWHELFNEAPGLLIQASAPDLVVALAEKHRLSCRQVAQVNQTSDFCLSCQGGRWHAVMPDLQRQWQQTGFHLQSLRDHPDCAQEELNSQCDWSDPGLHFVPTSPPAQADKSVSPQPRYGAAVVIGKPRAAIFREQGVNGQHEMAAAFAAAGFTAADLTVSDLIEGRAQLSDFQLLAACGGFSYGDVLGAGRGWAVSILFNKKLREEFAAFFARPDTLTLGVCNGCQVLSYMKEIIPDAQSWPIFMPNRSGRFESRLLMVEVLPSPSPFLKTLVGARLPIVVAHGEGRIMTDCRSSACLRFVDKQGKAAERYPGNPNGSIAGVTGLSNDDGRVTIMMPHPERLFRCEQYSWCPPDYHGKSPWLEVFTNARKWFA